MKVKNISVKPICIGSISLLPGETAQVDATYDDAMAFYISMGLLQEVQEVQEKKARGKNAKADSEADAPADAPAGGES